MAQYIENDITFSNIINPSSAFGGDGPRATYTKDSDRYFTSYYLDLRNTTDANKIGELFTTNAIDIHWGGAKPGIGEGENGINTTGELLSYIKDIHDAMPPVITEIKVIDWGLKEIEIGLNGTTTWKKGTINAVYSNGNSIDITDIVTLTLSSSKTDVATVSGNTITAITSGESTIRAIYTYIENGVIKSSEPIEAQLIVNTIYSIEWMNTESIIGNVGSGIDFGSIRVWHSNNGVVQPRPQTILGGFVIYTDSECTTLFKEGTQYENQPVWAKYYGTITTNSRNVTLTPNTYYMYVGITKPTSLSQADIVPSYPAERTYTNNSGTKSKIFVLTNSDKTVVFINPEMNAPVDQVSVDTTTISGYKIWETAIGTANRGSIKIQIS